MVILSSHFTKQLRLDPDVEYNKVFGTAGEKNAQALGAYSSIPIKIGNITTFSPAIILNAFGYNIFIGSSYLEKYRTIINSQQNTMTILNKEIPLLRQDRTPKIIPEKQKTLMYTQKKGFI